MIDLPDQDNAKYLSDHECHSKTQGKNSFLTSYDVFPMSRSFANEEVQNDKCFLQLCYFKVLKRRRCGLHFSEMGQNQQMSMCV